MVSTCETWLTRAKRRLCIVDNVEDWYPPAPLLFRCGRCQSTSSYPSPLQLHVTILTCLPSLRRQTRSYVSYIKTRFAQLPHFLLPSYHGFLLKQLCSYEISCYFWVAPAMSHFSMSLLIEFWFPCSISVIWSSCLFPNCLSVLSTRKEHQREWCMTVSKI